MFKTSHTRTVVRECYKDDNESLWKSLKFDPSPRKNTWTDRSQNLNQWLRHIYLPQCNILCIRPGFFLSMWMKYTVSQKTRQYYTLRQILTDFQTSFTIRLSKKLAIKLSFKIPISTAP